MYEVYDEKGNLVKLKKKTNNKTEYYTKSKSELTYDEMVAYVSHMFDTR